jgi:hypothetical protein
MRPSVFVLWGAALVVVVGIVYAADIVPNEIQQPGTQPQEIGNLESPDKCDNCHGGYNELVEPAFNWRGSMMANAGRDPIFWATLAVAEQDFDGAGDLCIRCHSTAGWLAGRSTPTDGSGLSGSDGDGVECDFCHKMTNPDDSELRGEQFDPFIANQDGEGYYGSGMASMWAGSEKLGPYDDPVARHQFLQSSFHRSQDFCGTCHDVSNPAVGDLAPNNGTQDTADSVSASGVYGSPVDGKAAFNNLPFQYGIVERTYSEYRSGALSGLPVSEGGPDGTLIPGELKAGAILVAYESAATAGTGGNYADGTPRTFTCQTCHMRPVEGQGCNKKGAPVRTDLPLHDMTGGNYWMPEAIKYLDPLGKLRLGGGLTALQIAALDAGATRAKKQLNQAVALSVTGNTVRVLNLTGHKLISGYPEGRRMWLNIKWYDGDLLLREDGEYGLLVDGVGQQVTVPNPAGGPDVQVESILDLYDTNTKVYEAHYGMTPEWAERLMNEPFSVPASLCLSYDRLDITESACDYTLGQLAAASVPHETFHFVLNNTVVKDNRIPPFGFDYDKARARNALPVPADQYGNPGSGGTYDYFDEFALIPPDGATRATIDMLYQPTSWEYIQFLWLANNGDNQFLADEGVNLLEAWLNTPDTTAMAAPYVMASATWSSGAPAPTPTPTPTPTPEEPPAVTPTPTPTPTATPAPAGPMWTDSLVTYRSGKRGQVVQTDTFKSQDNVLIEAHVTDATVGLSGAQVFMEIRDQGGSVVVSLQGFSDANGFAELQWRIPRKQAPGTHTATVTDIVKNGFAFDPESGGAMTSVQFTIQ